ATTFACLATTFACSATTFACSATTFACLATTFACSATTFACLAIASRFRQLMAGRKSPIDKYNRKNKTRRSLALYTCIFREESYGIISPNNSPYRKPINQALLSLKENGTYQSLYDKWFDAEKS
ncbi:transporter substrate-binding domain-containing protein, partial [Nostoc commune]|uniref:transporter substrate-binding domain-containing protein n=1 Tax=Nostoc commune TaxID=1178 RepID=UPI001E328BBD